MTCPELTDSLVVAEDARLAALISCALSAPRRYLPVIEGPRFVLPDPDAELIRRNNAIGRAGAKRIFLTGLPDEAHDKLLKRLTPKLRECAQRISTPEEIGRINGANNFAKPPLEWGRDRIGPGLLKALRARSSIVFRDEALTAENIAPQSDHLVVCEEGEDLAQVIAANYTYSLRAGLCLIPAVERSVSDEILENFYSLYEDRDVSPTQALEGLTERLPDLMGPIAVPAGGSITFITEGCLSGSRSRRRLQRICSSIPNSAPLLSMASPQSSQTSRASASWP